MVKQKVRISNPTGLHVRPAGIFCNVASRYKCRVAFEYAGTVSNAKSILSVLGACVKVGDDIVLVCDGEDEEAALQAMLDVVENRLDA